MEKQNHFGYWWIPQPIDPLNNNSENAKDLEKLCRVSGVLSFNLKSEISLELFANPDDQSPFYDYWIHKDIPFICGIADSIKEGQVVTLINCKNSGNGFSKLLSQKYDCSIAICHPEVYYFSDPSPKRIAFGHSQLSNWLQSSLLEKEVDIKLNVLGYNVHIYDVINTNNDRHNSSKNQSFLIEFEGTEELCLEKWMEKVITPFGHFLTLATDHKSKLTKLYFYTEGENIDDKSKLIPFTVFANNLDISNIKLSSQHLHKREMIFSCKDVNELTNISAETILSNWFNLLEKTDNNQDNLVYLYTASKGADFYQEPIFLNIVQALELYYNYKLKGKYDIDLAEGQLSSDEYNLLKCIVEEALSDTSSKIKDWTDEKIHYSFLNQANKTLVDKLSNIFTFTCVISLVVQKTPEKLSEYM